MTRDRDPDRRRPAPPHPGFAEFPIDVDTDVCRLCRALVPATELARTKHQEWDQRIIQLATSVLTIQLSDPGLTPSGSTGATAELSPGSGSTSERPATRTDVAPDQPGRHRGRLSDPNVPTPPQDDNGNRGGVEDANDSGLDAGLPPGVGQAPDAPTSPGGSSGAAKGTGRGSGGSGELPVSAPAGTTARLHLVEAEPSDRRMWT